MLRLNGSGNPHSSRKERIDNETSIWFCDGLVGAHYAWDIRSKRKLIAPHASFPPKLFQLIFKVFSMILTDLEEIYWIPNARWSSGSIATISPRALFRDIIIKNRYFGERGSMLWSASANGFARIAASSNAPPMKYWSAFFLTSFSLVFLSTY